MSDLKRKVINDIIEREGGYVNDTHDSGGETNYGITVAVARAYGYTGEMRKLPRSTAFTIYAKLYWDKLMLDHIEALSPMLSAEIADTAVNMGTGRAGRFLQRSLNVLNNRQSYYNDLTVDGAIGARTINALNAFLKIRGVEGEKVLHGMLNSLQGAYYVTLAERREKDEKYVYGWHLHRVS